MLATGGRQAHQLGCHPRMGFSTTAVVPAVNLFAWRWKIFAIASEGLAELVAPLQPRGEKIRRSTGVTPTVRLTACHRIAELTGAAAVDVSDTVRGHRRLRAPCAVAGADRSISPSHLEWIQRRARRLLWRHETPGNP